MALANIQYMADFDGRSCQNRLSTWPTEAEGGEYPGGVWTDGWLYWQQILHPYHRSVQIFVCPSGSRTSANKPTTGHYGVNQLICGNAASKIILDSQVPSPSAIYLMMDLGVYSLVPHQGSNGLSVVQPQGSYNYLPGSGNGNGINVTVTSGTISNTYMRDFNDGRHFNGLNMAYFDGHVKWLRSTEVFKQAEIYRDDGGSSSRSQWNPIVEFK